jgi:recombination protein RecT
MEAHAKEYSKGYSAQKGYTFWEKDFDSMAIKTMIRQLLSKWGMLNIDLESAIIYDQSVIGENGEAEYYDNPEVVEVVSEIPDETREEDATGEFFKK